MLNSSGNSVFLRTEGVQVLQVRVFYHDKCFDGACSASLFTRFHRECIAPGASYEYHGLVHRASALFDESEFTGDENGNVKQLHGMRVGPQPKFEPIPGTEFTMDADLVLLAMGFLGPIRNGMIDQFGVKLDPRGNVATDENYMSSVPGVFAAGDMRRGQSLVVWAIAEGRKAALSVDAFLMAETKLP